MAPTRPQKRRSTRNSIVSEPRSPSPQKKVPTKTGMTPSRSPIRRSPVKSARKPGLTLEKKLALMENIQLEVTRRARLLRERYNSEAQHLKMTIELRVSRIPKAYRKLTMAELIRRAEGKRSCNNNKPPPVPEKDNPPQKPNTMVTAATTATTTAAAAHSATLAIKPITSNSNLAKLAQARPMAPPPSARHATHKRLSSEMSGGDKENAIAAGGLGLAGDSPRKRLRGSPVREMSPQILSPTTSNSRVRPAHQRPASPTKTGAGFGSRPASPLKPTATPANALASGRARPVMTTAASVARAKATAARVAMPPPTISRKVTTSSTASSATSSTTAAARGRGRPPGAGTAGTAASTAKTTAAAGRPRRKVSGSSTTSSATTKTAASKTTAAAPKNTVMSTIRKGVTAATTKKTTSTRTAAARTAKAAPPPTTRSLRSKRN